ncbi:protein tyrosine kinase [Hydrococcus rivularis NIES-593]|uniref:Protein tyrosine kinase n=1 Tax=Hydrococcus rivularis NIES-593 TaxID=1921803 RepID=A0A1U7HRK1_9CYAN|nr:polysaccharide biosynthesis tyrosine autokinase [Hydrococcus rivularis]OKH26223.1 protein tyrosine kinase [Hydrococcus rivularis NIES-593]
MEDKTSAQYTLLKAQENGNHIYPQPLLAKPDRDEDEEIDLRQLWAIAKYRLRLIASVAIGVTVLTSLWTFTRTPIYEGKFRLLIGKPIDNEEMRTGAENLLKGLGIRNNEIDYDSQIEVLLSPSILNPIVEKIASKYPDDKQDEYDEFVFEQKKKKSPLQIERLEETKILEISFKDKDQEKINYVLDLLADAYLRYSLDERKSEIDQGIEFVKQQLPKLRQQVRLREEQLQQFRQRQSFFNPERQADLLSEQLSSLQRRYLDTRVRINELNSLYQILEKQLGFDPDRAIIASYLSEAPRYQELLKQLQKVEIALAQQSAIYQDSSPVIENLQEKRNNLLPLLQEEAQKVLGKKLSGVVANSPSLASPSSLRLGLTRQFIETANEREALQIRRNALERQIQSARRRIRQMPLLARQYTELLRELKVETEGLNRFLEQQQNLQIEAAQRVVPWRIIAKPKLGEDPVSPKPVRNLALGLVGGLLLGLGAAFLAERLEPVFHSSEELKKAANLPLLGVIPLQKDLQDIEKTLKFSLPKLQIGNNPIGSLNENGSQPKGYQSSGFLEAFRSLNTNIQLLGGDREFNSLVISSAQAGDGKSTVSTNLAQAAAAMGQRVLVIDADLRRPQVHKRLGIANDRGLSNVLATGLSTQEAIQQVPQWENLFVMTAGDLPPDPLRLLASKRMKQVIEDLHHKSTFDLIIYDTPPVLGFADGRILAALTSGIVLVTRINKTDRTALKNCVDQLRLAHVSILGLVANGESSDSSGAFQYGHYYSDR